MTKNIHKIKVTHNIEDISTKTDYGRSAINNCSKIDIKESNMKSIKKRVKADYSMQTIIHKAKITADVRKQMV